MDKATDWMSEGTNRQFVDDIPTMYFAADAAGTVLNVNRFGAEALGYSVDELVGTPLLDLVADPDRETVRESLAECLQKPGEVCRWEFRKRRSDGSLIWVRETARPIIDGSGDTIILIVCDEITAARELQDELRQSEERYRLLVDLVPQQIWITDPQGQHTYFSRRWYDYTGAKPEATSGEGWQSVLHPDDRRRVVERWQLSLSTGQPYEVEYRFRSASGEYRWFLGQAIPQRDDSGRVVRWIGTLTDIEEQKRSAAERERLLKIEREARTQVTTILESISDAFIAVGWDWRFVYMNPRGEQLLREVSGRSAGEFIGQSLPEAVPEVWNSPFGEAHRRAMAERTTVQYEGYLPAWGRWIAVHDYPSAEGLSIYFQDVTDRKLVEQERERLLESEQRTRAAAEQSAAEERALREAVSAVSSRTTSTEMIQQIAESAVTATGASGSLVAWINADRDEVHAVGRAGEIPPHPDRFPYHVSYTRRVVEEGAPRLIRRLGDADGPVWARLASWPFSDWSMLVLPLSRGAEPLGALFLARAPELAQFNEEEMARALTFGNLAGLAFSKLLILEEAQERRAELERITESRARLMRGFSHDLKNPLGAADGHAQLLEDGILGELAPKQMDSVKRIRRSINAALHLIQDLLELARAETGQIELQCAPADVASVAGEAVADFRAQAEARGLGLDCRVPDTCVTVTDPVRVRQILSNLLSNAVKYTPQGSVSVELECDPERAGPKRGAWIAINVQDTGPGVPAEKREQIFHEFTRLDPGAPHGAGVGLAISRRIARILGGDITLESEVGRGSRFTLWVPKL